MWSRGTDGERRKRKKVGEEKLRGGGIEGRREGKGRRKVKREDQKAEEGEVEEG